MKHLALPLAAALALSIVAASTPALADDPFGGAGTVVVGGSANFGHSDRQGVFGPSTTILLTPKVDAFIAKRWFVGIAPTIAYGSSENPTTLADGTSSTVTTTSSSYGVGVRLGQTVPLTDRFALRPVVTFSIVDSKIASTGAADSSTVRESVTARLELAYALTDRIFLTTGFGQLSANFGSMPTSSSGAGVIVGGFPGYYASLGPIGFGLEGSL